MQLTLKQLEMKNLENIITEIFNSLVEAIKLSITTNVLDYQALPIPVARKRPLPKRR